MTGCFIFREKLMKLLDKVVKACFAFLMDDLYLSSKRPVSKRELWNDVQIISGAAIGSAR
tara:strand:+ start:134 stop:313 length:180 start_codon:yes stop_codon:yes gene_type:complete